MQTRSSLRTLVVIVATVISWACTDGARSNGLRYSYTPAESTWAVRTALDTLKAYPARRVDSDGRVSTFDPHLIVQGFSRDSTGFRVSVAAAGGMVDGPITVHVLSSGKVVRTPEDTVFGSKPDFKAR